ALLALLFLQEYLAPIAWLGIVLTISGVSWVVVERTSDAVLRYMRPWRGIGFGLLAALAQASGAVMSRAALADTPISSLWATLIRLTAGAVVLLLWMVVRRYPLQTFAPMRSPRFVGVLVASSFATTFLGIWLQQTAFKYAPIGVGQSLTATSPLFVIPIAIGLRESVSLRAILGVVVAVAGIWLLFGQR
ncbi:MAG TPA: DMT family transporter, partial [Chroococcidiopsis sp.]